MIPKHIAHCISGGIDSVVALYYLHGEGHQITCISFEYKQRHAQEILWARHHARELNLIHHTIEIPQLLGSELTDGKGGVVVPFRNGIFLSLATNVAVAAGADTITIACNKDDEAMFPDCRMAFIQAFNQALLMAELDIEVCAPFIEMSKAEIVALGRRQVLDFDQTWSCYRGGLKPCGECLACQKRQEALSDVNPSGIAPLSWHLPQIKR